MNCNWHYIESCISETTLIETGKESCPAFITILMINTTTKSNLKRKWSIWLVYSNDSPSLRELREETEAGGMEVAAYGLAPCGMHTCLLILPRAICSEMATFTVGCVLPHQSLIKRMPPQMCLQTI